VHATEADRFSVQPIQGVPTAGNPKGLRYATTKNTLINDICSIKIRLTNVEKTNSALQQANLKLEAANLKLEQAYKTLQQKMDVQECLLADLKTFSDGYKALRNRFLSVFKRRTVPEQLSNSDKDFISGGNAASHNGDCLYDAKLYFETRARRDYNVYAAIYGLAPGVVATAIEDTDTIHLLNTHTEAETFFHVKIVVPLKPNSHCIWGATGILRNASFISLLRITQWRPALTMSSRMRSM